MLMEYRFMKESLSQGWLECFKLLQMGRIAVLHEANGYLEAEDDTKKKVSILNCEG